MYDSASNMDSRLSDYILNDRWQFPTPVSDDLRRMIQALPSFDANNVDSVEWVPNRNKQFSVAYAKELLRTHGNKVEWFNIVWFHGYVPKFAFIEWMLFKDRLLTRDKLRKWGCIQEDNCALCSSGVEDCNHLFFACGYSSNIWKEVMRRNGIERAADEWRSEYVHALT